MRFITFHLFFFFFFFFFFETNVHDFLYVAYNNPHIIFPSKRGQSVVGRRFTISTQTRHCKLFFFF